MKLVMNIFWRDDRGVWCWELLSGVNKVLHQILNELKTKLPAAATIPPGNRDNPN